MWLDRPLGRVATFQWLCYIGYSVEMLESMTLFAAGSAGSKPRRFVAFFIFGLLALALTGCLVRRRTKVAVEDHPAPPLKTASLSDLLGLIQKQEEAIRTLDATATIEPSVNSPSKGEIVHYRDVRTFILIRRPAFIRMIGLYPVVENKAFDMSSDGETFRLYIPVKNRFIMGKNRGERRSKSALENLRPQVILDALLLKGPEPGKEQAVLESFSEAGSAYYIVHIIRIVPGQLGVLERNIWFDRRTLEVVRIEMFDDDGEAVTDVLYAGYSRVSGIPYPQEIIVERPKDLYGLHLSITNLQLNQPVGEEKFVLDQPPGSELVDSDQMSLAAEEGK
jgi:outer membrane lipoprotein-sorting protein